MSPEQAVQWADPEPATCRECDGDGCTDCEYQGVVEPLLPGVWE